MPGFRVAVGAAALTMAASGLGLTSAQAEIISAPPAGQTGNSRFPSINASGEYTVFQSTAAITSDDTNDFRDVYLRGRGSLKADGSHHLLMSVSPTGEPGNGDSTHPSISDDGRTIAFLSTAANLVTPDPNGFDRDLYIRRVPANRTWPFGPPERLARIAAASQPSFSVQPDLSADGSVVAFVSADPSLVASDPNGSDPDVYVYDNNSAVIERIGASHQEPALSSDGNLLAFVSSEALVVADTNEVDDAYLYDRTSGSYTLLSTSSSGAVANHRTIDVAIAGRSNRVAFSSWATNLVAGDTNGRPDVFLRELATGTVERISVASDGTQANDRSIGPSLSDDGSRIAFETSASNLTDTDPNPAIDDVTAGLDIYIHDLITGATNPAAADTTSTTGGDNTRAALAGDGQVVVWESSAPIIDTDVLSGVDTNPGTDIFSQRLPGSIELTVTATGTVSTCGFTCEKWTWQGSGSAQGLTDATLTLSYYCIDENPPFPPIVLGDWSLVESDGSAMSGALHSGVLEGGLYASGRFAGVTQMGVDTGRYDLGPPGCNSPFEKYAEYTSGQGLAPRRISVDLYLGP
jgi:Tol biopolymer transport system component